MQSVNSYPSSEKPSLPATPPHLFLHPSPPATTPSTPFIYPFYFPSFLPFMSDLYWFYYGSVTHPARVVLYSHHVRAGLWLRDPQANGMVQRGFLVTEPPLHIVVLYPEMTNRPKTSQNALYLVFSLLELPAKIALNYTLCLTECVSYSSYLLIQCLLLNLGIYTIHLSFLC